MLETAELTPEQVDHFLEDGFLVCRKAFNEDAAGTIQKWCFDLAALPEEVGKHWIYHEASLLNDDIKLINRIENIAPFHKGFRELAECLNRTAGQLLGEEAVLFKDKINFKMPGGDGFKPHQDVQAGWGNYASYFVSVMVCIDVANIENGCLQLAPRLNKQLVGDEWKPLTDAQTLLMDFKHYPTAPGDVIYFDSYVAHASEPNLSNKTRRLYFATYNRLSEGDNLKSYFDSKRQSFPPDIERELGKEYVYRV